MNKELLYNFILYNTGNENNICQIYFCRYDRNF